MLKHLVLAGWTWTAGDGQLEAPKGHLLAEGRQTLIPQQHISYRELPLPLTSRWVGCWTSCWCACVAMGKKNLHNSVKTISLQQFSFISHQLCMLKETNLCCLQCSVQQTASETEVELHSLRNIRVAIYSLRPQILKYLLHFHRKTTVRIKICPSYDLKKKRSK